MDVFQFLGPTYPAAVMFYVRQRALFGLAAFDSLVKFKGEGEREGEGGREREGERELQ
jgi:hypothetical protein